MIHFLKNIYLFIWLRRVLVAACRIFTAGCGIFLVAAYWLLSCRMRTPSCGMWDLVPRPGSEPKPPALAARSPSHWTTREVPLWYILIEVCIWHEANVRVLYFQNIQLSQHHWLKRFFHSSIRLFWHPCWKSFDCICGGLFLDPLFYWFSCPSFATWINVKLGSHGNFGKLSLKNGQERESRRKGSVCPTIILK